MNRSHIDLSVPRPSIVVDPVFAPALRFSRHQILPHGIVLQLEPVAGIVIATGLQLRPLRSTQADGETTMRKFVKRTRERLRTCRISFRGICQGLLLTLFVQTGVSIAGDDTTKTEQAKLPDIAIERIFGPEHPDQYKHPASFTELANGDLYLAY